MNAMEKLSLAWEKLRMIPVNDIHVDTMHDVRVLLADAYKELKAQQKKPVGEVKKNETP